MTGYKFGKFRKMKKIPYGDHYDPDEFQILQSGLKPETSKDLWEIYFKKNTLYCHRAQTGQGVYQIRLKAQRDGSAIVKWAKASKDVIVLNRHYEAALLDFLIANIMLGLDVPFPRHKKVDQPIDGAFQNLVFGTNYAEAEVTTRTLKKQFK